ncbi:undecaprenyl-pyrophosphate phosphatase [Exiguobacterium sp. 8H]|uniref:undecaprenyl-diphosphate phosphatase n=1 Tax=Exiguobacterium TaxID=33986 RepID=UPI0012EF331F|nr:MULTISPECIES: undecaprenyl-diphosphate phosphatase [Exiguobacterium]VXB96035.1 undecaprenyl-pyrophosphate phosphatase [Exiguobacterium sp. 8H]VXC16222.1 undecaprenyl-pyrophosphate phosphatase [Exiguobacterium sp. 8A]
MEWYELFVGFLLGVVEGLTEFAPVSSTGHMILVDGLWLNSSQFLGQEVANTFKIVIQLGSILAVVVVFRDRFKTLLNPKSLLTLRQSGTTRQFNLIHILIGLLPAGVLGVLFEDYIDTHLFSVKTVLIGLVVGAFFMIAADLSGVKRQTTATLDDITYKQALGVGLIQCFSLWPGFSRSGSTISGGVLLGMSHRAAADFTFIMAVPIMFGASALSLYSKWTYFTLDTLPVFVVGFVSAFLFALLSIKFFLKLINKVKLMPFAVYRIVLAIVIYVLYF